MAPPSQAPLEPPDTTTTKWYPQPGIACREGFLPDGPHQLDARTVAVLTTGLRLIALRSLSNADDADDVVQETLARGLSAMANDRIHNHEQIGAYFRGILRHVITDLMRVHGKTVRLDLMAAPPAATSPVDALATLISSEDSARVVRALQALPQRSRECLQLGFYEGLTPAETAERLHEPGSRVRKRRSRALQLLRAAFFRQNPPATPLQIELSDGHDPESSATYIGETYPSMVPGDGPEPTDRPTDRKDVDER